MPTTPLRIPAFNPGPYTGDGNNTWLIDGEAPTLIDAGTGKPEHLAAIQVALGGRSLARVIVTHGHSDHASGVPALKERWPAVDVLKWRLDGEGSWTPIEDGQIIHAGDRELRAIHTPGHARDHVSLWDEARREAYTGDMVMRPGTVLIPAGKGGNLREYLQSLDRLAALNPVRLFPGHGPTIEDPQRVFEEYIAHRRAREAQVLACMATGLTTAEQIVAHLYPGLKAELQNAATMTVQAHLDKINGL
jgi:glyoxylase-like metal-dependent hydrolase (beta-lactamase superfamily II)